MKLKANPCAGFTLLELMVIVGLIGMLAAIFIPTAVKARNTSQTNACVSNLRQIQSAILQCAMELKKTPTDSVTKGDVTPYMRKEVSCPAGGTTFDDSYLLTDVATEPTCKRVPLSHTLQQP